MLSDPLTLDKLLIVILLLVPGFISMRTWALIVPSRHRSYPESLIDIFTYGLLNYLLLFWLIKHIAAALSSDSHPALLSLAVIMYGLVFPALWPMLWWVARKSRPFRRWALHPQPKAWDYVFGQRKAMWILVHLKNGNMIGGRFDAGSFASTYPVDQDIYIGQVWKLDEDGHFLESIPDSAGTLIDNSEIEYLEFFATDNV